MKNEDSKAAADRKRRTRRQNENEKMEENATTGVGKNMEKADDEDIIQ